MEVTLAYPWQGHQPNDTVEVGDGVGRMLIREGRARPVDVAADAPGIVEIPNFAAMSMANLRALAAERGLEMHPGAHKATLIDSLTESFTDAAQTEPSSQGDQSQEN